MLPAADPEPAAAQPVQPPPSGPAAEQAPVRVYTEALPSRRLVFGVVADLSWRPQVQGHGDQLQNQDGNDVSARDVLLCSGAHAC